MERWREQTKANWVDLVSGAQCGLSLFSDLQVGAVVGRRGGVQPDARVTAFVVVVGEDSRVGPWSLVMSQFQISLGRVASSSGRFFAGCVRWARRSLEEPLLANFPCNS